MSEIKPCPERIKGGVVVLDEDTALARDIISNLRGFGVTIRPTHSVAVAIAHYRVEACAALTASLNRASDACASVQRERDELREEIAEAVDRLRDVQRIAVTAFGHWDADRDSKVGKILAALSGFAPGYTPETDALNTFLARYDALK